MVDGGAAGLQLITAGPAWQGRDVREAGGLPAGHTPVPYGDEGVCVAQWLVRRHLATRARGGTARPAASAFGRSQAARPVTPSPSRSKLHQLRGLQLHTGMYPIQSEDVDVVRL